MSTSDFEKMTLFWEKLNEDFDKEFFYLQKELIRVFHSKLNNAQKMK